MTACLFPTYRRLTQGGRQQETTIVQNSQDGVSVSYTHLDVYKRQPLHQADSQTGTEGNQYRNRGQVDRTVHTTLVYAMTREKDTILSDLLCDVKGRL